MRVVTPTDMRARLGEILDAASAGERILIERDHKPLAVLMSVEEFDRIDEGERQATIERRLKALDDLVAFGKEMRVRFPPPDDGLTEAEWIQQAREERMDRIEQAAAGYPEAERGTASRVAERNEP